MAGAERGCVVIGAGLTAAHTIRTLREGGYQAPITLVGEEDQLPYERPPLSKGYLEGRTEVEKVYPHPRSWYDEQRVGLHLADPATGVDPATRQVHLRSGATLGFDWLVLATGASPRHLDVPGGDRPEVHVLRTLEDSTSLRSELGRGHRWVVVGGGWIGLEVAAAARTAGDPVTVLEMAETPLGRVLGERLGRHFADLHRARGVDLRTGVTVEGIEATSESDRELVIRTSGGTLTADRVVAAVGVLPNVALAEAAGLHTDNGILVDEQLRTADRRILAAGDVASAQHATLGQRLRVEHWDNAIRQGRLAAQTVLGTGERYDWAPYFFTDQYDLGMEYVGHHGPEDRVVIRGDTDSGEFLVFWLAGDTVTAGMNVNIWDVNDTLRSLIGRSADPSRLADPEVDLGEL